MNRESSSMVVWPLANRDDPSFAVAGRRGTWAVNLDQCRVCDLQPAQERVAPLVVEWEKGADRVGDFTWVGPGDVMVTERAAQLLEGFGPMVRERVVMKWPRARRRRPSVAEPYQGLPNIRLVGNAG